MAKELKEMTKRADNYSQWYNDLVIKADLIEQSAVRGCMVIKPYGYAIWEKIQAQLDKMFKETGVQNAYFPMLIPKSFLSRSILRKMYFTHADAKALYYYVIIGIPDADTTYVIELRVTPDGRMSKKLK